MTTNDLFLVSRFWKPGRTGERLFQFTTTQSGVEIFGVAFAGGGKSLATRSRSGTVTLWDIDAGHWTEMACPIVNRNLTREKWERFPPSEPYRLVCPALPVPPEATAGQGS